MQKISCQRFLQKSFDLRQWTRKMAIVAKTLKFSNYGKPADVLEVAQESLPPPEKNQVLVKILTAPINPADINTIQGKYPVKPKFPAIAGNECVGEIQEVGSCVKNLKKGQRIVPFATGLGTWSTHAIYDEDQLLPISDKIGLAENAYNDKGVMVTYGGMAREPIAVATAALIFKDISFRGFWMTRWTKENCTAPERFKMFEELSKLIEQKQFAAVYEMVPLDKYKDATKAVLDFKGFTGKKYILCMQ
uniref:Enoyl-[acyl-carrier-protein] reductase, mitochondrial n=1 Tax=Glossina pallidipes TaxID=7398 RepID=A0A1A9ZCP0_GLOPL